MKFSSFQQRTNKLVQYHRLTAVREHNLYSPWFTYLIFSMQIYFTENQTWRLPRRINSIIPYALAPMDREDIMPLWHGKIVLAWQRKPKDICPVRQKIGLCIPTYYNVIAKNLNVQISSITGFIFSSLDCFEGTAMIHFFLKWAAH